MKAALVNPSWDFEGSIYFGCREPHLPIEFGYAGELLENIPRPYLHWLAGEQEQLSKTIHEYLALTAGEDEEEET